MIFFPTKFLPQVFDRKKGAGDTNPALAPGGNLISAPRLRLRNIGNKNSRTETNLVGVPGARPVPLLLLSALTRSRRIGSCLY